MTLPPPQFIEYATPASRPRPDRRGWVIAAGVLLLVLGALCGCVAAAVPFANAFTARIARPTSRPVASLPVGSVATIMVVYVAIAAGLIWVGVGACRCRRWVRPIVLAVGWPALVLGAMSLAVVAFTVPEQMQLQAAARAGSATGAAAPPAGVIAATIFFVGLIYLGLPGAFLFLFRQPAVARTLAHYDPRRYWTDRLPTPVLTMMLFVALVALTPLSLLGRRAIPAFGTYLHGSAAVAAVLLMAVVALLTLVLIWKLRPVGWWLALLILVVPAASFLLTVWLTGVETYYGELGLPADQAAMIAKSQGALFAIWPATVLVWAGFLIYCRRFFVGTTGEMESGEGEIRTPGTV